MSFLATDGEIISFLQGASTDVAALRARLAAYRAKYSVYRDILVLDTQGRVCVQLDTHRPVRASCDPLVAQTLAASEFVETFHPTDLSPDGRAALVYSHVIRAEGAAEPLGVLCLMFDMDGEVADLFSGMARFAQDMVIMLLDSRGEAFASSDTRLAPLGRTYARTSADSFAVSAFGSSTTLAVSRPSEGYQGYEGQPWQTHVLRPAQSAFASRLTEEMDVALVRREAGFSAQLTNIEEQASDVMGDLTLAALNGQVMAASQSGNARQDERMAAQGLPPILDAVRKMGIEMEREFHYFTDNLLKTVTASRLNDASFLASITVEIMDRNLYERANDCRWWALTSAFRELLAKERLTDDDAERLSSILRTINGLYTVYANLIVFDRRGQIVAVSQPDEASWIGKTINEDWVRHTLTLADSQSYAVSAFAATPLYAGRHTYLYSAAIRAPGNGQIVGGVGIVFDSRPQFAAMLQDALPRDDSGAEIPGTFGLFVDRSGGVIASTSPDYRPGAFVRVSPGFLALAPGEARAGIELIGQTFYAVGARMSSGYREYKGEQDAYRNDVAALVFVPLCGNREVRQRVEAKRPVVRSDRNEKAETVEVATFLIGNKWFGLRAEQIAESVDYKGTTPVPGAGCDFAGYLMYKDNPIPVFDIGRIVDATPPEETAERQVIVLRKSANGHFGILVDDLGEIPEVSASRLQILPEFIAGGNVLADTILMTDKPDAETLLIVLSVNRIATRLVSLAGDLAENLSVIEALIEA